VMHQFAELKAKRMGADAAATETPSMQHCRSSAW